MKKLILLSIIIPSLLWGADTTLSSDMDAFLVTANDAAARTELGALAAGDNIGAATATTPSPNDNDTSVATTAYVQTELTAERQEVKTFTLAEPDILQGIADDWVLFQFLAEKYPSGVTITSIHISGAAAYTSETFLFEHWDDAAGSTQATIESITSSAITTEDDGTLTDATIPADYFFVVNLDDTPEDKAYVAITISFTY